MEFDFLPKLPKSDLDDRTFQDLVQECLLRIPRYCPEWTNYNPSDPGITLVELFAWLTDQMLLRFNQVPRRNYVTFLELLGIRLQPLGSLRHSGWDRSRYGTDGNRTGDRLQHRSTPHRRYPPHQALLAGRNG